MGVPVLTDFLTAYLILKGIRVCWHPKSREYDLTKFLITKMRHILAVSRGIVDAK